MDKSLLRTRYDTKPICCSEGGVFGVDILSVLKYFRMLKMGRALHDFIFNLID